MYFAATEPDNKAMRRKVVEIPPEFLQVIIKDESTKSNPEPPKLSISPSPSSPPIYVSPPPSPSPYDTDKETTAKNEIPPKISKENGKSVRISVQITQEKEVAENMYAIKTEKISNANSS